MAINTDFRGLAASLGQFLMGLLGKGRKSQLSQFKKRRAAFFEDLAVAYGDGIAIIDYISLSIEREGKRGSQKMAAALKDLHQRYLAVGHIDQPFAEALRGFVPESERILVMAYERAGKLEEGLFFVAQTATQIAEMRGTLRKAILAPLLPLSITFLTVWVYAHEVIPMIELMIDERQWSLMMRLLRSFSQGMNTYGLPLAAGLGMTLVWGVYQLPRWVSPNRRRFDDRFFPIYRDYVGALFLISYAALQDAGVGQAEALQMIAKNAPRWLRWHCQQILSRLARFHDQPGLAFDTGIFPQAITDRLVATATSSKSKAMFQKLGGQVIAQTSKHFDALSNRVGVTVELLAGAITLFLTLAVASIASNISV